MTPWIDAACLWPEGIIEWQSDQRRKQSQQDDRKVKAIAERYGAGPWRPTCRATINQSPSASTAACHVVARKAGATRFVEVETADTLEADRKQHATFRRSAAQQDRTRFEIEEA